MGLRFSWENNQVVEPPDKKWDEGERPPAQWQNWVHRKIFDDLSDLNQAVFVDAGSSTGQLKGPLSVGGADLYQAEPDNAGADLYHAYNATWTGSDWEEVDSGKNTPALLAYNITDVSKFNGISASDVYGDEWVYLRAASISNSVITWEVAPINAESMADLRIRQQLTARLIRYTDEDGDGNFWEAEEDLNDGHLHYSHPDLPGDIVVQQDGTIHTLGQTGDPGTDTGLTPRGYVDNKSGILGATYFDSPVTIQSGAGSGTLDVSNNGSLSDDATSLLVLGRLNDEDPNTNPNLRIKHPSHANWKVLASIDTASSNPADDADTNSHWVPLENGQLDFDVPSADVSELEVHGER